MDTARYWLPAVATAALIFGLSHQPELPGPDDLVPDKLAHGIEYGFFTLTLAFGTTRGFKPALRTGARITTAVVIAALYGITDELHQSFVGRDATMSDWFADVIGALLAAAILGIVWPGSRNRL
jgi:VanZ family protein